MERQAEGQLVSLQGEIASKADETLVSGRARVLLIEPG